MTAAVYRNGTPSLSIPQTQNTAPVLEFNCLYTHDLRRKAKRWQDGFLRYHTFNRRVMVYDVPRNFVGRAHWTAGEALQDGDEVMLEKDGVMVQVAEAVGRTETDLTELRNSRKKGSNERGSSPPGRGPQTPATRPGNAALARPLAQLKHRSLNALLGTPKGPIGKAALPAKSPFETRHNDVENERWEEGWPPKRQRMEAAPAKKVPKPEVQPLWARTADAAIKRTKAPLPQARQSPQPQEVGDLREDEPEPEKFLAGFPSDALVPLSSPPREKPAVKQPAPPARSNSPAFQTQKAPAKRAVVPEEAPVVRKPRAVNRHIEISTNDAPEVPQPQPLEANEPRRDRRVASRSLKRPSPVVDQRSSLPRRTEPEGPPSSKAGATLRVAAGASKKNTLLCQDQLPSKPKRVSSTNTDDAADTLLGAAVDEIEDELSGTKTKTQRQLLDERLARISAKQRKADTFPTENTDAPLPPADQMSAANAGPLQVVSFSESNGQRQPSDSAFELAKLDEMISAPVPVADDSPVLNATSVAKQTPLETIAEYVAPANVKGPSPRKKKGVGRREIRASAQSCFPEPVSPIPEAAAGIAADACPKEDILPRQETQQAVVTKQAVPEPPNEHPLPFRRTVTETEQMATAKPKRMPGAPMRFTPSPQKRSAVSKTHQTHSGPRDTAMSPPLKPAGVSRNTNRDKKTLRPAVSLNTAASGTAAVMLGRPFQALKPAGEPRSPGSAEIVEAKPDPWSREAFDLFGWRPPGWDEEGWCFKDVAEAVEEVAKGAG
ncbi:hypothetical protein LTR91_019083 [Friedmanniomyces endolithicus]|uniref:5'-3' DNA helicase ZGRF1-like N-terminal domain-containing protein n=1 Tax=Friedmanniomyces endolithicus TaxID=329885 RepID=A0AAN6HEI8_9PEZI|nr:hypothetical protein LTR57_019739 [Friedmanniomyces endolithicus]KAK0956569.1 hypothetical protein LTS01_022786 [Friedmanniomyces endolithicus]KAK0963218.1 hypothetical protein LTR91_019083 [Friedmanniomyces endolithicus]KAK1026862.1 hypothetical protein LTS16_021967 [Friedmanniomyces endolithicus]